MIAEHWNRVNNQERTEKETKTRDYITFSDVGKAYCDRYLKMAGEKPSNEFSERVLRIFDAGKTVEETVTKALIKAGILNKKQAYIEIPATKGRLKQLGYLDATVGGHADWDKAVETIKNHLHDYGMTPTDSTEDAKALAIIEGLRAVYPNGIVDEVLVEIKSINSLAFWGSKNRASNGEFVGYIWNKLQMYGYMKATGINKGLLLYVSRDDGVMSEIPVLMGTPELEKLYNTDIEEMSHYYLTKTTPPLEPEVVWDDRALKFNLNWKVERSNYLTRLYGYPTAEDLEAKNHQLLLDLNRALKHVKEGKVKEEDIPHINRWRIDLLAQQKK